MNIMLTKEWLATMQRRSFYSMAAGALSAFCGALSAAGAASAGVAAAVAVAAAVMSGSALMMAGMASSAMIPSEGLNRLGAANRKLRNEKGQTEKSYLIAPDYPFRREFPQAKPYPSAAS